MKIFAQIITLTMAAMLLTACGGDDGSDAASAADTAPAAEAASSVSDTVDAAAAEAAAVVGEVVETAQETMAEATDDLMASQVDEDAEAAMKAAEDGMKDMEMEVKVNLDGM